MESIDRHTAALDDDCEKYLADNGMYSIADHLDETGPVDIFTTDGKPVVIQVPNDISFYYLQQLINHGREQYAKGVADSVKSLDEAERRAGDTGRVFLSELQARVAVSNIESALAFTTIRYLGWLGEGLIGLPGSARQQGTVEAAGHCCDRIEHIAQYEVDAANREGYAFAWEQRARMLAGDVEYIRLALNRHAKTLVDWRGYLPTMAMLDDLTRAFAVGPSSTAAEAAALGCCDKQPTMAPDAPIDVNIRIKQLEAALAEADRRAGCAERNAADLQNQLRNGASQRSPWPAQ